MKEIDALGILTCIPHLGAIKIRQLIRTFGSPSDVLENFDPIKLINLPGFSPKLLPTLQSWEKSIPIWEKNLELVEKLQVQLIPFTDPLFPKSLCEIPDCPVLLYVLGKLQQTDVDSLAVIGTRNPSIYGSEAAKKIARDLASHRITVVSGLARGIDTAAHEGALEGGGRTIAVIGSGLANIYPRENRRLAEAIAEQGAVISEFPMDTPPDRTNFPQRNRIVGGMTRGTLLVEAPEKSGAMITVEKALSYQRPIFALPGRIDSNQFCGNHLLIKQRKAQLMDNILDLLPLFNNLTNTPPSSSQKKKKIVLDSEEENLLTAMPQMEVSLDDLKEITHMPISKLTVILMRLLIKQTIKEFPGKLYKKVI